MLTPVEPSAPSIFFLARLPSLVIVICRTSVRVGHLFLSFVKSTLQQGHQPDSPPFSLCPCNTQRPKALAVMLQTVRWKGHCVVSYRSGQPPGIFFQV